MKPIEEWTDWDSYQLYCSYGIVPDKFSHIKDKKVLIEKLLNGKCPCGCGGMKNPPK